MGKARATVTDLGTTARAKSGLKPMNFAATAVAKSEKVADPTTDPNISGACLRMRARC